MNRYYPTNVESLRASQRRAFDSSASASMFSELIDKHGRNDWLDPVMDHLGPYVYFGANLPCFVTNFGHVPPVYAHFWGFPALVLCQTLGMYHLFTHTFDGFRPLFFAKLWVARQSIQANACACSRSSCSNNPVRGL